MMNKRSYKIDNESLSTLNDLKCDLGKIEGKTPSLAETNRRLIKLAKIDNYIKDKLFQDSRRFKGGLR